MGGGSAYNSVYLNQEANLGGVAMSVTDANGSPIPGAKEVAPLSFDNGSVPAVAAVPKQSAFQVKVDGSKLQKTADTDVTIIGPGYDFEISKIVMDPGEIDTIRFDPATNKLSYQTSSRLGT